MASTSRFVLSEQLCLLRADRVIGGHRRLARFVSQHRLLVNHLGLDVGGSRCRYEWWPADASRGGEALGVQPAVHGVERTALALAEVLAFAAGSAPPAAAVCAVAGAGDRTVAHAIVDGLHAHGIGYPVAVVGDVLAAAAAGLRDGPGVLLWSGTGSFAVARSADGRLVRVGGRGYAFGDQGSAYDLVRRAIQAALAAVDQLGPGTMLTESLTRAVHAPAPERLGAVAQAMAPREVAAQLPVVLAAHDAGDPVARRIVALGVEALIGQADAAVRLAGLPSLAETAVSLGGGVLAGSASLREVLTHRMEELAGQVPVVRVLDDRDAARGAAWLAYGWHQRLHPQREWVEDVAL